MSSGVTGIDDLDPEVQIPVLKRDLAGVSIILTSNAIFSVLLWLFR